MIDRLRWTLHYLCVSKNISFMSWLILGTGQVINFKNSCNTLVLLLRYNSLQYFNSKTLKQLFRQQQNLVAVCFHCSDFSWGNNLTSKTGDVSLQGIFMFRPTKVVNYCKYCARYLHAWCHATYSLLTLGSKTKLLIHWKRGRGGKSCLTDGKTRCNILVTPSSVIPGVCSRSRRWALVSRDPLQRLNHKVTASCSYQ